MANDAESTPPARGASKLSMLISFVAGAVACYLFLYAYGAFNPQEQNAPQPSPAIPRVHKPVAAAVVKPGGAKPAPPVAMAPKPAHP